MRHEQQKNKDIKIGQPRRHLPISSTIVTTISDFYVFFVCCVSKSKCIVLIVVSTSYVLLCRKVQVLLVESKSSIFNFGNSALEKERRATEVPTAYSTNCCVNVNIVFVLIVYILCYDEI
jgi:hypothetical protein